MGEKEDNSVVYPKLEASYIHQCNYNAGVFVQNRNNEKIDAEKMLHYPTRERLSESTQFSIVPLSEVNNNSIVMMQHHYYRTHPVSSNHGSHEGAGGRRSHNGQAHAQDPGCQQEMILHPALFGGTPPRTMGRAVPNLLPRYNATIMGPLSRIPSGPGAGSQVPRGNHSGQGGTGDPFLEEQVKVLAEKIEGLEGELRYAWRALDVLSQEYVKMWQRLEKMEGLLSEQQTVITQLIDLYSADSSDNGTNGGLDKDEILSPSSLLGGINAVIGGVKCQACPDENFYKALNAVHGESANTEMQLALSRSQSIDNLEAGHGSDPCDGLSDDSEQHSGKVVLPPHPIVKSGT